MNSLPPRRDAMKIALLSGWLTTTGGGDRRDFPEFSDGAYTPCRRLVLTVSRGLPLVYVEEVIEGYRRRSETSRP